MKTPANPVSRISGLPQQVVGALRIGVDLGPNLSVTGSLAKIHWLAALRREGQEVSVSKFLGTGLVVMSPVLLLALGSFVLLQVR